MKGIKFYHTPVKNEKCRLCLKDIDPPADAWICSEHFSMLTTDLMEDLMTISTGPEEEETNYSSDEEGEIDGVILTQILKYSNRFNLAGFDEHGI